MPKPADVTTTPNDEGRQRLIPFDFRRPDRISKSQLQAIQNLHEILTRNLAANLSGYLGVDLSANVQDAEQTSFKEFRDGLSTPSCVVGLNLRPFQGFGLLHLSPTLIFPMLEIVMGGTGQSEPEPGREITEIELKLLDSVLRLILQDLR